MITKLQESLGIMIDKIRPETHDIDGGYIIPDTPEGREMVKELRKLADLLLESKKSIEVYSVESSNCSDN